MPPLCVSAMGPPPAPPQLHLLVRQRRRRYRRRRVPAAVPVLRLRCLRTSGGAGPALRLAAGPTAAAELLPRVLGASRASRPRVGAAAAAALRLGAGTPTASCPRSSPSAWCRRRGASSRRCGAAAALPQRGRRCRRCAASRRRRPLGAVLRLSAGVPCRYTAAPVTVVAGTTAGVGAAMLLVPLQRSVPVSAPPLCVVSLLLLVPLPRRVPSSVPLPPLCCVSALLSARPLRRVSLPLLLTLTASPSVGAAAAAVVWLHSALPERRCAVSCRRQLCHKAPHRKHRL